MSLFLQSIILTTDSTWGEVWEYCLVIPAAVCLIYAVYSGFSEVQKTKNTVEINVYLFMFLMMGGLLFTIAGVLSMIGWSFGLLTKASFLAAAITLIPNAITTTMSSYVFVTKIKNKYRASLLRMTEKQYFDEHIAPKTLT